ncbi:hypothetical protein PSACC_02870 [Paramicrosporidium saccamoebae]|uniref:Uncharacterized protein n=1 Tax=Paramicrosporidium saccamoebae TaxID=1246581 RepID=A0A2H9THZ8_9FUNG|nr:hypothetical protein PSACC_02870 [Paramicrosporidium saccamoebae]
MAGCVLGSPVWGILREYFETRMVAIQLVGNPTNGMLFGLLGWTIALLGGAAALGVPVPTTLTLILGLLVGARVAGLSVSLMPLGSLLIVHGVVMAASVVGSLIAHYMFNNLVNKADDPLDAALWLLPFLFVFVIPIHGTLLLMSLFPLVGKPLSPLWMYLLGGGLQIVFMATTLVWARVFIVNRTKRLVFERHPQNVLEYAPSLGEQRLAERGMVVGRQSPSPSADSGSSQGLNKSRAEESFTLLLLAILAISGITQGILDMGTILGMHRVFSGLTGTPRAFWLLGISSVVLSVPMVLLTTRRIAKPLGDIAALGMMMTTAVELGCYLPMQAALFLGWPISPVLCKLPAVLLVAWLGGRGIHRRTALQATLAVTLSPIIVVSLVALTAFLVAMWR